MSHHPGYKSSSTKTVKVEKDKTYIVWTGGQAVPVYMNGTDELVVPISDIVETVDSFASRAKLENKRVPSRPLG